MSAEPPPRLPGEATWKAVKARIAKNNEATHSRAREARNARDSADARPRSAAARRDRKHRPAQPRVAEMRRFSRRRGAPRSGAPPEAVTQRLDRLEAMIEGLQDAVYREAQRQDRQIEDVR